MTYKVTITFNCCGDTVTTTNETGGTGKHTEHCLACDTASPSTDVQAERLA